MVSQAVKYASIFFPILAVWMSLILNVTYSPLNKLVLYAPIIAIFIYGIYCLISLYLQVVRFQDRPDEAESLKKEIQEAKADLRKKGIKVDKL